ncbi:MAG TPA: hypothetical protein VNK52_16210 [Hyphomicrobiaceae bacterium]|nr:hypothetical protein [Hyphomicrobiaceae bacterium]
MTTAVQAEHQQVRVPRELRETMDRFGLRSGYDATTSFPSEPSLAEHPVTRLKAQWYLDDLREQGKYCPACKHILMHVLLSKVEAAARAFVERERAARESRERAARESQRETP